MRGNVTPQLGNSQRALPPGFSVQIVPLRYVGVREMMRLLEPFAQGRAGGAARRAAQPADPVGHRARAEAPASTRSTCSTSTGWRACRSGVFTLQNADVKSVMTGARQDRRRPQHEPAHRHPAHRADRADERAARRHAAAGVPRRGRRSGSTRLDQGGGGDGPQLLRLPPAEPARREARRRCCSRRSPAARRRPRRRRRRRSRPARRPARSSIPPTFQAQPAMPVAPTIRRHAAAAPRPRPAQAGARARREGSGIVRNLQVVADKDNNTLLIIATRGRVRGHRSGAEEARRPAAAGDDRSHDRRGHADRRPPVRRRLAVQGRRAVGSRLRRPLIDGRIANPINPPATAARRPTQPGAVRSPGLHLHHQQRQLPGRHPGGAAPARHLRQHQGRRQPARRRARQPEGDDQGRRPHPDQPADARRRAARPTRVTTTSQYIDTGVLLQVTPHINAGGLVTLDVQAEVSIPGQRRASTGDRAADQHALGADARLGPVGPDDGDGRPHQRDARATRPKGIPLLSRIPILGGLFGNQKLKNDRTELVLFITPRVVENEVDIRERHRRPAAQDGATWTQCSR